MTCEERKDELLLYAAGALNDAEREALAAHLATGCPQCAGALAEAEATLAMMPADLSPVAPPARAREALMQRVRMNIRPGQKQTMRWPSIAVAASIGLILGSIASFAVHSSMTRNRELALEQRLQDKDASIADLQRLVGGAQMISLERMPAQPKARGRVIWDREKKQWRVYVFDMMPPPPGKTYELWFITPDKQAIPSDTFNVGKDGNANLIVSVPDQIGPIALAGITDEPIGGSPVPTGNMHLKGEVPAP